jgi:ribosomal-protein-serine acetyltransferase
MFPHRLSSDISLELLDPRHAEELFRVTDANREHLREWLPWVDEIRSEADTKEFIQLTLRQLSDNNGFQTAIRFREELVGVIGHHGIHWGNRSTSLGYWLARGAQGKGFMTQSCLAYVDHSFAALSLNRVEIRCAVGNKRSRAIPERLGFHAEGTLREAEWLYDHFVDHVVYSVLASEWTTVHLPPTGGS